MARPTYTIISALRSTACKLETATQYQWGHMGSCNCGFLAQEVTKLTKKEIHARAMAGHGDWNEQLNDYCPTSGLPMDELITELLDFGFDADDLKHLERLDDREVLEMFPPEGRNLRHNLKRDVVKYLHAWADLLEIERMLVPTARALEEVAG